MQYRQPRLGDIVDDYCPRERRLTNHAVVAMVGPDIKQTRCTTCDTEHEYKHAKVPAARKKKESAPALFKQVLAGAQPEAARVAAAGGKESDVVDEPVPAPEPAEPRGEPSVEPKPVRAESRAAEETGDAARAQSAEAVPSAQDGDEGQPFAEGDDDGPVHRRLIRATLPRPEGGVPAPRPLPQFTVRQPSKFGSTNRGGSRPGGGGQGGRPRTQSSRGAGFGRNAREVFTGRVSGNPHHAQQRPHPAQRQAGRPLRHGKKSPK